MTSLITGGHMAQNDKINDDWEAHWSNFSISAEENPAQGFRRKIIFRILKSEKIVFLLLTLVVVKET